MNTTIHHRGKRPNRTARGAGLLGAAIALGLGLHAVPADASGARRPVIFVPGTMATAFNGSPGQYNLDTPRVWLDLDFRRPWDLIKDSEVEAYFKLEHKTGSSTSAPIMDRGGGRTVSYVGSASSGYFTGLVDYDLLGTRIHLDLRDAFQANGYVPNQTLFNLRYDWVQKWDPACTRLASLVDEARGKSGADKVFLVGHSQGTQVIDYCLIQASGASTLRSKTAGVVHFAPPTRGGSALSLYANLSSVGLGHGQAFDWYAKVGKDTARRIMRSSPAMYMMLPDRKYEAEIHSLYPWIVGSYAEFNDHYVCKSYCTPMPGAPYAPPQYALSSRVQQVPSAPNLPYATRESQFSQRLFDPILAPWSLNQRYQLNLASKKHSIPQLTLVGAGIDTAVNYSVHHHSYDRVRPDFPMPARSHSMVYASGDGTVPRVSTYHPRSHANSTVVYSQNLSSTSGCDDRDHVEMFKGACAAHKVGQVMTWLNGVGSHSGSAASAGVLAGDKRQRPSDLNVKPGGPAEQGWRNISFFLPASSAVDASGQTVATLTLPEGGETLLVAIQSDGSIGFVGDDSGRDHGIAAAQSRRVLVERVPSTTEGVDLVQVSVQVPMANGRALRNSGVQFDVSGRVARVLMMSETVAADSGERSRDAPTVFAGTSSASVGKRDGLRFEITDSGEAVRR